MVDTARTDRTNREALPGVQSDAAHRRLRIEQCEGVRQAGQVQPLSARTVDQEPRRAAGKGCGMNPIPIIESVANVYGRTVDELTGPARYARLCDARHLAMVLIRVRFNWSMEEIGRVFGNRDHTTVLHAIRSFPKRMKSDPHLEAVVKTFYPEAIHGIYRPFTKDQIKVVKRMVRLAMKQSA